MHSYLLQCVSTLYQTEEMAFSGFAIVLRRIAEVWREKKDLIRQQGADTIAQLAEATQSKGDPAHLPCQNALRKSFLTLTRALKGESRHGDPTCWYDNSACNALSPCLSCVDAELHAFFSSAVIPHAEQMMCVENRNSANISHGAEGHDLDAQLLKLTLPLLICSCGQHF